VLILDEASQMTEPLSLLAIAAAKPRFMLVVGDPNQLPPTVSSFGPGPGPGPASASASASGSVPTKNDITRTLFSRLQVLRWRPTMLRTQYRCHPAISGICSRAFYNSCLIDGVSAEQRPSLVRGLPPVSFVNCAAREERERESYKNTGEAGLALELLRLIRSSGPAGQGASVGVICMYRPQSTLLARLAREAGASVGGAGAGGGLLKVSTVDAFQGSENDIILVLTSRSSPAGGREGSFLSNAERVNVAISRARHHLIVVGSHDVLRDMGLWRGVLGRGVCGAMAHSPQHLFAMCSAASSSSCVVCLTTRYIYKDTTAAIITVSRLTRTTTS
jgi:superfamily I DNA and/or RNA helicase